MANVVIQIMYKTFPTWHVTSFVNFFMVLQLSEFDFSAVNVYPKTMLLNMRREVMSNRPLLQRQGIEGIPEHGLSSQLKQLWKSKGHVNAGDVRWTAALATIIAMSGMQVLVNLTIDSENHPLETSHQL